MSLSLKDPEIAQIIDKELNRQTEALEMIASENYVSKEVLQAQGSILTNKYAEGLPYKRYYGGCEFVDASETLAIERVKQLFKVNFANVQAHSGSQANMACFFAELKPGDKIMGLKLSDGGHLTHGSPVNFSGKLFQASFYDLNQKTERLDFNLIESAVKKERPKLIIAGFSAYPRCIDFKSFKEIASKYNCILLTDIAHIAGLVAGGLHPSPVPYADYITSTTHKTLRGPRGGLILCQDEEKAKKMNSCIFPGIQGGPLEHVIAAKAVAFKEALLPEFKNYCSQIIKNSQTLAEVLKEQGLRLVTGGTDNHLILVDLSSTDLNGKQAESVLDRAGITVNKNTIPNETQSPFITSGIRIGTAALTTRGMKQDEMKQIGEWIIETLRHFNNEDKIKKINNHVRTFCRKFPLYA